MLTHISLNRYVYAASLLMEVCNAPSLSDRLDPHLSWRLSLQATHIFKYNLVKIDAKGLATVLLNSYSTERASNSLFTVSEKATSLSKQRNKRGSYY